MRMISPMAANLFCNDERKAIDCCSGCIRVSASRGRLDRPQVPWPIGREVSAPNALGGGRLMGSGFRAAESSGLIDATKGRAVRSGVTWAVMGAWPEGKGWGR